MTKENVIIYANYRRKSTDEKDRQVLSLESQNEEIKKMFPNLKTIKMPDESISAFEPYKRPTFRNMVDRIKKGEIQGIVAWHPDRLSRNPMEAAEIIYLLDKGLLKDLKFCNYTFENSPEGKMFLQFTLSQSKYSSDKLSKDVKRGMHNKALGGWRPGLAPLGYKNSKTNVKGEQVIHKDEQRFNLVKQAWQMMLTGNYTVPQIFRVANEEWKLTQPATGKRIERKLQLSKLYKVFTTPFYYGYYQWNGEWIKGNHDPMITEEEYDRVQFLMGRDGRPRPKTHLFAYTGLMRCGSCNAMITAEEKWKHQKNGNVHHYIYYHCTKRMNPKCTEKAIELKEFEKQIDEAISQITIPEKFRTWAIKHLHEVNQNEAKANEDSIESKNRRYERIIRQIDNLILTYASPNNATHEIMTEDEYMKLKNALLEEKRRIESELKSFGVEMEEWVELSEKTFNFARYSRIWFAKGDLDTKRAIFACLGSHLVLKDKKVQITLKKPFQLMVEGLSKARVELNRLEPVKMPQNSLEFSNIVAEFPLMSG